jgi:hypothetical protein
MTTTADLQVQMPATPEINSIIDVKGAGRQHLSGLEVDSRKPLK